MAPKTTVKPVASASALIAPLPDHPARWVLHPSAPSPLHARVELPGGDVLYAGDDGERWLDHGGTPVVATSLLSESIVSVARTSSSFLFVSKSGSVYVVASNDPLGPPVAVHSPQKPMHLASAGKNAVLGVQDGALMRSTDAGATWSTVSLPTTNGTLRQVAMRSDGAGLLLFAPQHVMATTDDGATWTALATPGVGGKRVVADSNGDLMLEGLVASGILRTDPLRLEKIARAPAGDPDLPMQSEAVVAGWAKAIDRGNAVMVGTNHFEVAASASDESPRWSFAATTLTDPPKFKPVPSFDGCTNVLLAGATDSKAIILEAGCVREPRPNPTPSSNGYPSKKIEDHWNVRLFRSDDRGATWKPDGASFAVESGARRLFVAPDGTTIVDGGCKWSKNDWSCEESPPVVRVAGAQTFAKVVGRASTSFHRVVFSKDRAYALGVINRGGRIGLYVSTDGGKDFQRKTLPATSDKKEAGSVLAPDFTDKTTSLTVDESGAVLAAVFAGARWVVYETKDDGVTFAIRPVLFDGIDQVQLAGHHGLAWSNDGKSYETSDGGVSWSEAEAPHGSSDRTELECNAYGCMLGDLATRVGWNDAPGSKAPSDVNGKTKGTSLSPITCTPVGGWSSLGALATSVGSLGVPDAGNADLGGGTRLTSMRHEKDGSVFAVVGIRQKEGKSSDAFEVKDVQLFGPAPKDTATASSMQLEGVAALRYTFKRDAPTSKKPGGAPWYWGQVKKDQVVDVEVAWYLASDGKVHRATLKGAGPMQPTDVYDRRDQPSVAQTGVLSIAMGGIHVRAFKTAKPDAPLYFVSDAGKIETLTWPEMPKKDARGRTLDLSRGLDAARIGNRSLVFGYVPWQTSLPPDGMQIALAWSSGTKTSTSWDERAWGLWPRDDGGLLRLRYVDSGPSPAFVILYEGERGAPSASWMIPLKGPEADPSAIVQLPTAGSLPDVPRACGKADWNAARFTLPSSEDARHPLVVQGDFDLTMATREAVVRVTTEGKDACVSTWDATMVGSKKTMEGYSALLPLDDLERSALFRNKNGEISLHTMRCEIVKGGPLPKAFEGIEGFAH